MISKDKQYRTRDGREVRIYATDAGGGRPVHGAYKSDGKWFTATWTLNGDWTTVAAFSPSDWDLIEVKPRIKRTVWLNVYPDPYLIEPCPNLLLFTTKAAAEHYVFANRLACVKVEIDCEEGEGL